MPKRKRAATCPDVSDRLLRARGERHRTRYVGRCDTCAIPGAVESIRESLGAMVADPARHRGVALRDVWVVMREATGGEVKYETFLQHVRNHESDLYARWSEAQR